MTLICNIIARLFFEGESLYFDTSTSLDGLWWYFFYYFFLTFNWVFSSLSLFLEACLKFPPADDLLLAATTWVCSPEATFVQNQRLWDAVAQAVGVLKGPAVTPTCPGRTQLRGGQICLGCPRDWGGGGGLPRGPLGRFQAGEDPG